MLAETSGGSNPATYYLPGLGQDNGTMGYFGTDGLGSVRQITDSNGVMQYAANFDPYGSLLEQNFGTANTSLGYTGAPSDPSGLVYLNARFYNPSIGSFQTHDPFGGSLGSPASQNGYNYVEGNPATFSDPSGKCVGPLVILCVAAIVGGLALIHDWHDQVMHNQAQGMSWFDSVGANNINWNSLKDSAINGAGATAAVGGLVLGGVAFAGAVGTYGVLGALGLTASQIGIGLTGGVAYTENNIESIDQGIISAETSLSEIQTGSANVAQTEGNLAPKLQEAIVKGLNETDIDFVAFRDRAEGAEVWDGIIPSKPEGAKNIGEQNGLCGIRLCFVPSTGETNLFVSDADAAFAIRNGKSVSDTEFLQTLKETINANYLGNDAPIVMHGAHINGIIKGIPPTFYTKYLNAQVYVFGREGFIESGNLLEMYQKYLLPR